jgi:hypothetical protein
MARGRGTAVRLAIGPTAGVRTEMRRPAFVRSSRAQIRLSPAYEQFSETRSICLVQQRRLVSHAEAKQILRRAGYSQEQIDHLLRHFPDPIDTERDAEALFKHGISADRLMDRMGGSP